MKHWATLFKKVYVSIILPAIFITAFLSGADRNPHRKAVVIEKIADLNSSFPAPSNPPASPDTAKCPRAHQVLFNEVVDVIDVQNDYVQIACPNVTYGTDPETGAPRNTFWTFPENIVSFANLSPALLSTVPNPSYGQEPTIVLTYPWHTFSVGTRFKNLPEYDTGTDYTVIRADYENKQTVYETIPHGYAIEEKKQNPEEARKLFVTLINDLVDNVTITGPSKVIAYIWGGSSFAQAYTQPDFYQKDGVWLRKGQTNPYTGYDCSEFVMRMAQISGLEFPWKTTTEIQRSRRPLTNAEIPEEGDLIWTPGHLMIISNLKNNEIIESRDYGSGYGCVHRASLSECLVGIDSYAELLKAYHENRFIIYKNKTGNPETTAFRFQILKLTEDNTVPIDS